MSVPDKAVFLSYASQDTEAAKRICEALRAAGVEVWFDQSELRGGDAWDAKIRKQIKECALFVPIISATTNARPEGYFRLEWKLAVDRSHLLAEDHPFLFPIAIGDVTDATARVPEKFREVQWTRLRLDETPGEVATRVMRLLSGDVAGVADPGPGSTSPATGRRHKHDSRPAWVRNAWSVMGLAFAVYFLFGKVWRRARPEPERPVVEQVADGAQAVAAAQKLAESVVPKPTRAPEEVADKSVAVLAFANLSDDKANEYFSDGISEELLNVLAKVPGLKVTARTSAFHFKGKEVPIPEIAKQLGVAYVVEGSVQKQGNQVRIRAQLIKAADGFHVWSDTFTRDLKDIFAVQDEIAGLISQQLQLKLGAAARPARVVNPEAYRLLLQARAILNRGVTAEAPQAIQLLKDSLAIDDSALAWSLLAMNYIGGASQGALPAAEGYNLGRDAANRAIALDPELPLGHAALASVQFLRDWDWAAASASLQHARDLAPGDAGILAYSCNLAQTLGQTEQALQWGQRAVELDPLGFLPGYVLGKAHFQAGQYAEMERLGGQMIAVSPAGRYGHVYLVYARLLQGKVEAAAHALERMSPDMFQLTCAALVRHSQGRNADSETALRTLKERTGWGAAYQIAEIHAWRNEVDQAFEWLETAYREHDAGMTWLLNDPFLKNLRGDSRWPALVKKMNLPLPSK
jgi:TolB-like protein